MDRLRQAFCTVFLLGASLISTGNATAAGCFPAPCFPNQTAEVGYGLPTEQLIGFFGDGGGTNTFDVNLVDDVTAVKLLIGIINPPAPAGGPGVVDSIVFRDEGGVIATFLNPEDGDLYSLPSLLAGVYQVDFIGNAAGNYSAAISAVPIPAAAVLFGSALLGFVGFATRRRVS